MSPAMCIRAGNSHTGREITRLCSEGQLRDWESFQLNMAPQKTLVIWCKVNYTLFPEGLVCHRT